jgi:hypothetical protein
MVKADIMGILNMAYFHCDDYYYYSVLGLMDFQQTRFAPLTTFRAR